MRKIVKYLSFTLAILIISTVCLPLTACHGAVDRNEFVVPEEFDTSRNYEIVFWSKNDTNVDQMNVYKRAIKAFEEFYPNIKVVNKLYTNYGDIYYDVITNISTDTTPNVCISYPDHIATYLTGENVVVPLENLFNDEKYGFGGSEVRFDSVKKEEIIPKFLNECKVNGQYHAIPYMRSTEACYINKDFVEKLGYEIPDVLTWDFIWEVSDKAAQKGPDGKFLLNGQNIMIPFIYKSTDNMMIQMLKQKNGGYSTEQGDILIFNDTTKDLLYEISDHAKKRAFSTFKISSYPANYLNAGQCVFAIDSTAGASWMGTHAPLSDISEDKLVEFETVVKPIPQFDTENPQMISQGPSICIFNKEDPQEVLASWLFAQFMLTNEVQLGYAKTEGYIPVTSRAQDCEEYKDYLSKMGSDNDAFYDVKIKASKMFLENIDNTFVTPVFNGSASLRDASGQMIEEVVKQVRMDEPVDEAFMDKLYKKTPPLFRLDSIEKDIGNVNNLGELPKGSKALLWILLITWVIILTYFTFNFAKKRRKTLK